MRTSIQACGTATTTLAWPKPSGVSSSTASSASGDLLADQVLAGDAEMRGAGGELADDLGGRQEQHLDVRHARERAAIVARAARCEKTRPARAKNAAAFSCRRPFEGTARIRAAHRSCAASSTMRSSQNEQPTAGIGPLGAEVLQQPIVAAAADDGLAVARGADPAPRR